MELLGKQVKDTVHGLEGIVSQFMESNTGLQQYAVQPMGDGKTIPDAVLLDVDYLVVTGEGVTPKEPVFSPIQLGDEVEDIIDGFVGIAVTRITHLNGCLTFDVKPQKLNKDGTKNNATHVFAQRLRVKKAGKLSLEEKPGKGGPASKAPRLPR